MITPWDSIGMGKKLHVDTDLEANISLFLSLPLLSS